MNRRIPSLILSTLAFLLSTGSSVAEDAQKAKPSIPTISEKTSSMEMRQGFFDFYWDHTEGEIWLRINQWDEEFLYVNALATGMGSNDIGLDRNQLGGTRIVKFQRVGKKVLLIQPNYDYRAVSDNAEERRSVEEAFAQSVLWGFKVEAETNGEVLVNLTKFLLRDAHGIVSRLKNSKPKQGDYAVDDSRSAIYLEKHSIGDATRSVHDAGDTWDAQLSADDHRVTHRGADIDDHTPRGHE